MIKPQRYRSTWKDPGNHLKAIWHRESISKAGRFLLWQEGRWIHHLFFSGKKSVWGAEWEQCPRHLTLLRKCHGLHLPTNKRTEANTPAIQLCVLSLFSDLCLQKTKWTSSLGSNTTFRASCAEQHTAGLHHPLTLGCQLHQGDTRRSTLRRPKPGLCLHWEKDPLLFSSPPHTPRPSAQRVSIGLSSPPPASACWKTPSPHQSPSFLSCPACLSCLEGPPWNINNVNQITPPNDFPPHENKTQLLPDIAKVSCDLACLAPTLTPPLLQDGWVTPISGFSQAAPPRLLPASWALL